MTRCTSFALLVGLLGCAQREQPVVVVTPAAALATPVESPALPATAAAETIAAPMPRPAEARPPAFDYPDDLAGRAVARAVAPAMPKLTPTEKFGAHPTPRAVPAKVMNPEPTAKASVALPPLPAVAKEHVVLSPPRESVPFDLGAGATMPPVKPSLPVSAGITERARDVGLPPAMPVLGRPFADRVSLEDPTSEFANNSIVAPAVKATLGSASFQKVTLPDPFELGEQVKPKLPPAAEPGLVPVPINPARVK